MNERKVKKLIYNYLEQYNTEYFQTPKIDSIKIINSHRTWGEFETKVLYQQQRVLKIEPALFDEKERFIKQTLYHEFTHMYDSTKFLSFDEETYMNIMQIYSEVHASEIEMDIILNAQDKDLNDYMNHELERVENQFIMPNGIVPMDNTKFTYKIFYYFVGKLLSTYKHNLEYKYKFSDELNIEFILLFKEIINYFMDNAEYDFLTLIDFQHQMKNTILRNIKIHNNEVRIKAKMKELGLDEIPSDLYENLKNGIFD